MANCKTCPWAGSLSECCQTVGRPARASLLPYQQRVVDERNELEARLDKLAEFTTTPAFEALAQVDQARLLRQSGIMIQYSDVLAERIAAFPAT